MQHKTKPVQNQEVKVSQITLPKGGGTIKGLGETFQPEEFSGTGNLRIPLPITSARGLHPKLELLYSQGSGNSIFGWDFALNLPTISRRTDHGVPLYQGADTFILFDSDHLTPKLEQHGGGWRIIDDEKLLDGITYRVQCYRPRTEGLYSRIEHWTRIDDGTSHWQVRNAENVLHIYGRSPSARVGDPELASRIFQWNLEETIDAKGNRTRYEYKREDRQNVDDHPGERNRDHRANVHLHRVLYGNYTDDNSRERWAFQVVFNYGEYDLEDPAGLNPDHPRNSWEARPDPYSNYRPGFEVRTHRRCQSVLLFHHFPELGEGPQLVKALELEYEESKKMSFLSAVRQIGFRKATDGNFEKKEMPPLEFSYQNFSPEEQTYRNLSLQGKGLAGYDDGARFYPVDLYGEGITGILYTDPNTSLYFTPLGDGKYGLPQSPKTLPINTGLQNAVYSLQDIDRDGNLELTVNTNGINGYYALRPDRSWEPFRAFPAFPTEYESPLQESLDVNGNGLVDMIVDAGSTHRIYCSKGRNGWSAPTMVSKEFRYPTPRTGSEEEVLLFADLFGDGMDHRVRISKGLVEVWPNLGHGKFGKPVKLGNAPSFYGLLNAEQVFTADIDGTGYDDIIYVHSQYLYLYLNQSGNSFSDAIRLRLPERFSQIDQIHFADILGDGTTSLVITYRGPNLKHTFYSFSGDQKPYGLIESKNNLGAVTRIAYCSSTKFYLADKQAGRTWVSQLPHPVQVIEKTETIDQISGSKLVARYAYHHGHYDPWTRTFQGFGMVERWDTEAFEQYNTRDLSDTPFQTTEERLHTMPIYTKTWYHTGVFRREGLYSTQFESEYFKGDPDALNLADSSFEEQNLMDWNDSLSNAYRALKGQVLREEVYSLNRQQQPARLFSVTENNAIIRTIQPKGPNKFGVYQAMQRETLRYDYEWDLHTGAAPDPRVSHTLIIEFDTFGQALKTCELAYPRRSGNRAEILSQQELQLATCEWKTYFQETGKQDWYLWGLSLESRSFELSGLGQGGLIRGSSRYYSYEVLKEKVEEALANIQPYELQLNQSRPAARRIHWQRTFYWKEAENGSLIEAAFGEVDGLALEFKTETAMHSQVGIHTIFAEKSSPEALDTLLGDPQKGGYLLRDDGYWWNPKIRSYYLSGFGFYQLYQILDPFNSITTIEYDPYYLAIVQTIDALNNRYLAEVDYQVMQPERYTDLNGNTTEVLFDPLGLVRATSVYGTEIDRDGVLIQRGDVSLADYSSIADLDFEQILATPHEYLQGATAFFHYDYLAWRNRQEPPWALTLQRETHLSDTALGSPLHCQVKIAYSDGFGRPCQEKLKAESGLAWAFDGGVPLQIHSNERWLTSGRTVYDNKGNPVKQYEPFYSSQAHWSAEEAVVRFGVSPIFHYDPLARVVRKDLPKGFFEKMEYTPWEIWKYDANDTLADSLYYQFYRGALSEKDENNSLLKHLPEALSADATDALYKTLLHAGTPLIQVLDVKGRIFQERKLMEVDGKPLITHTELDIQDNTLSRIDPRLLQTGQPPNLQSQYDMNGAALINHSADAGSRWTLFDATDSPIQSWDSRGFRFAWTYDLLGRPVNVKLAGNGLDQVVESYTYGESTGQAKDRNLRGRLVWTFDQAGAVQSNRYSIHGELLESSRSLRAEYKAEVNWNEKQNPSLPLDHPWKNRGFEQPDPYTEVLTTRQRYDALGRLIEEEKPLDSGSFHLGYHPSGRLNTISGERDGSLKAGITGIDYNAQNLREQIRYENGVSTRYQYDPDTWSLTSLVTQRQGNRLQDIQYTYDPVRNITRLRDNSHKAIFTNNALIEPLNDYTYDALYRLIIATGRHRPGTTSSVSDQSDYARFFQQPGEPNDATSMRNYERRYTYDESDNLTRISEQGGFARRILIAPDSNRAIVENSNRPTNFATAFDANGNLLALDHLAGLEWNYRNNIAAATLVDRGGSQPADAEYYVYGQDGRRIRKVGEFLEHGGSQVRIEEKIYLSGFEISRTRYEGNVSRETRAVHLMDDTRRIAIHRWVIAGKKPAENAETTRYQLGNHLDSAAVEVNGQGELITYEEYYPFGGTALVAGRSEREVREKEYRYSGKEKDTHTGLYCYGVRYYAPWLGRWMSPDPAGAVDGLNLYAFVLNNPIRLVDQAGFSAHEPRTGSEQEVKVKISIPSPSVDLGGEIKTVDEQQDQGGDILLRGVQEGHLPHEAWHVVQQRQGQVRPAMEQLAVLPDPNQERDDASRPGPARDRNADEGGGQARARNNSAANEEPARAGGLARVNPPTRARSNAIVSKMEKIGEGRLDVEFWLKALVDIANGKGKLTIKEEPEAVGEAAEERVEALPEPNDNAQDGNNAIGENPQRDRANSLQQNRPAAAANRQRRNTT